MYSGLDPKVRELSLQFCGEAERIWANGKAIDSAANLAAMLFLSLGYLGHGRDHLVLSYLTQAIDMGQRMGLFESETGKSKRTSIDTSMNDGDEEDDEGDDDDDGDGDDDDDDDNKNYAAWGTFNLVT